jgi:hypothetical protein
VPSPIILSEPQTLTQELIISIIINRRNLTHELKNPLQSVSIRARIAHLHANFLLYIVGNCNELIITGFDSQIAATLVVVVADGGHWSRGVNCVNCSMEWKGSLYPHRCLQGVVGVQVMVGIGGLTSDPTIASKADQSGADSAPLCLSQGDGAEVQG